MHPYTAVIAQQQFEELRREAAERRLARTVRPTRQNPLTSSLKRFADASSTPLDDRPSFLPRLTQYPYRG